MKFYLDKNLAKQGIAKCIAVSENDIDLNELKERMIFFNVKDVLIYNGSDIPHKFIYDISIDNIKEVVDIQKDAKTLSLKDSTNNESEFDENVIIDNNKQYFYLDKEYADMNFKSQIVAVFQKPLKNPSIYFNKETYCYIGNDVPYYISIENGKVRKATEIEKYNRGQRPLEKNEYILNNEILTYDIIYEYIDKNGNKQNKSREQLIKEGTITLESEKQKARIERENVFKSLDLYDKAVLRGDIIETKEDKNARDKYRTAWLNIPNNYVDVRIPIETLYPVMPKTIEYFNK